MANYVTGETIRILRERKGCTQRQLAEQLSVSDKTISKWETGRGLPDSTLLTPLAEALGVTLTELFTGEQIRNGNRSANLLRSRFYLCPLCGNIITAVGSGVFSCCGITLPALEPEEAEGEHAIRVEQVEYDWYVTMSHPMERTHHITFFALVTSDRVQLVKQYPEQNAETRFPVSGGWLYACCGKHGLFRRRV